MEMRTCGGFAEASNRPASSCRQSLKQVSAWRYVDVEVQLASLRGCLQTGKSRSWRRHSGPGSGEILEPAGVSGSMSKSKSSLKN